MDLSLKEEVREGDNRIHCPLGGECYLWTQFCLGYINIRGNEHCANTFHPEANIVLADDDDDDIVIYNYLPFIDDDNDEFILDDDDYEDEDEAAYEFILDEEYIDLENDLEYNE